jgi:hypothetical protein
MCFEKKKYCSDAHLDLLVVLEGRAAEAPMPLRRADAAEQLHERALLLKGGALQALGRPVQLVRLVSHDAPPRDRLVEVLQTSAQSLSYKCIDVSRPVQLQMLCCVRNRYTACLIRLHLQIQHAV